MKHFYTIFLLLLIQQIVFGQAPNNYIFTTEEDLHRRNKKPENTVSTSSMRIAFPEPVPDTATLVRIPVVFNVIHLGEQVGVGTNISDSAILGALDVLNDFYRKNYDGYREDSEFFFEGREGLDTKVEFYLANLDNNCNYSYGIRRFDGRQFQNYESSGISIYADAEIKNATKLNVERFLNIWVVSKITPEGILGYANMPGSYGYDSGFGTVNEHDNLATVLPHEIGHLLGLDHDDMDIGGYTQLHSFKIVREAANFYKSKELGSPITCTPANAVDGAITGVSIEEIICEGPLSPTISLTNHGSSTISSCEIEVYKNNQLVAGKTWTGSLTTFDTAHITLNQFQLGQGNYNLEFRIKSVNNGQDIFTSNNSLSRSVGVAGLIQTATLYDFENNQTSAITLTQNSKSSAALFNAAEYGGSNSIMLQGKRTTKNDWYINTGELYSPIPFHNINKPFFSTASFCIAAEPGKHFELNYNYSQTLSGINMRVLANGHQAQAPGYSTSGWRKQKRIVSSHDKQNILVTFQAACMYSHKLEDMSKGSYVLLDNIEVKEIPATDFVFNFENDLPRKSCLPLEFRLMNNSYGAPMPDHYVFLIEKTEGVLDTVRDETLPWGFSIDVEGEYSLQIFAYFRDGSVDSVYYEDFLSTVKQPLINMIKEDVDNFQEFNRRGHYEANLQWRVADVGSYGKSSKSYFLNIMDQNPENTGAWVELSTPPYNASTLEDLVLQYDYAYAAESMDKAFDEYMNIKVSADCGKTWKRVATKWGIEIATTAYSTAYADTVFVPEASEWRTETISLSEFAKSPELQVLIEFKAEHGNALYLDNLLLGAPALVTGTENKSSSFNSVVVFPNPATDMLTLKGADKADQVTILNTFGQVVLELKDSHELNVSDLTPGVYTIRAEKDGKTYISKFVKK